MHQQADAPSGPCAVACTDCCLLSLSAVWCLQLLLLLRSWDTPGDSKRGKWKRMGCQEGKNSLSELCPHSFPSPCSPTPPTVMLLEVSVPSAGDSCAHLSQAALPLRADPLRTLALPRCVPGAVLGVLPGCSFFPRH